jgi:hypothetical protein
MNATAMIARRTSAPRMAMIHLIVPDRDFVFATGLAVEFVISDIFHLSFGLKCSSGVST